MASFKAMGTGAKAALLAGGAVIASAAGYGVWSITQPVPPPDVAAETAVAEPAAPVATDATATPQVEAAPADATSEPEVAAADPAPEPEVTAPDAPEPATEPDPAPDAKPEAAAPTEAPSFDVVRVDPNGSALIAGRAAPGATVIFRIDGVETTTATADANGDFVALFVLDASDSPRLLTMATILPDQTELPADAEVALAPTAPPVEVAAAEPATAPEAAEAAPIAPEEPVADAAATPESPETDAPAALLITKEGVTVLQDGSAAPPDSGGAVSIDTISYTPSGAVQLAGQAVAGSFVRIYLDNVPLIDIPVSDQGLWAATMPEIVPGIYTLRADELAADGKVTSRFETPFKRETPEALAAAAAATPAPEVATAAPEVVAETPEPAAAPEAVAEAAPAEVAAAANTADPAAGVVPDPATTTTAEPAATEPAPAETAVAAEPEPPVADPGTTAVAEVAPATRPGPISVTVQPGFTLWGIASEQFGDGVLYVQVYAANKDKIRDPDLIYPGQVFVIPERSE